MITFLALSIIVLLNTYMSEHQSLHIFMCGRQAGSKEEIYDIKFLSSIWRLMLLSLDCKHCNAFTHTQRQGGFIRFVKGMAIGMERDKPVVFG